ncbi:MAG TPA: hypothetical protein VNA17_04675 [Pyrinomonadaceae bacterium]|nr:hypothetical protein [Pyrinomonadaceae bacterium]
MDKTAMFSLFIIAILALGCGLRGGANAEDAASTAPNPGPSEEQAARPSTPVNAAATSGGNSVCGPVSMAGKVFVRKQSFAFDHEPFRGGCFVTFASKDDMVDERDVPRGSTFHIFKEAKKVYDFPDAFGGQTACWVEAVSFKDLNADGKTDVIMAGKCLGARDSYPANAVYANTGREFTTNDEANNKLESLRTSAQIEQYVKRNLNEFF